MNVSKYYQDVDVNARVLAAKPYELTTMLLERAQSDLKIAKIAIEAGEIATKCKLITSALDIVSHLDGTLNPEPSPQLYEKLHATYEYLSVRLVEVNAFNDLEKLTECQRKLTDILDWWKKMVAVIEETE
jgi:flagellar protein FliS